MILIDMSGIVYWIAFAYIDDINTSKEKALTVIRSLVINNALDFKRKFKNYNSEIIFACDGGNSWRKKYFKYYKDSRASSKEQSNMNWDNFYYALNNAINEIQEYTPFHVINIDGVDADDVIGCISIDSQNFGRFNNILIAANDGDFKQLLQYDNIKYYNIRQKEQVKLSKKEIELEIITNIVKGQQKDGYPSIKSQEDHFVREDSGRQKSISSDLIQLFLKEGIEACEDDIEKERFKRNQTLYDFHFIPDNIKEQILNKFDTRNHNKYEFEKSYKYFAMNRCSSIIDRIEEF